ncbi:MAG: hypothetical protein ACRC8P_01535 [Spiroplasma sp.]
MSVLLASDNDIWDKLFAYLYDNFLFVADVIWNTKLPLTDISIGYWLIFWMVIRLSIYAVNGASTGYNDLAPEIKTQSAVVYSGVATRSKFVANKFKGQSLKNPKYQAPPPIYKRRKTVRANVTKNYPHDKKLSYSKKSLSYSNKRRIGTTKPNWTFGKHKK